VLLAFRVAFIQFETVGEVESAIEEKQGEELEGNSLYLNKAGNKPKPNQNRSFDRGQRGGRSPGDTNCFPTCFFLHAAK